MCFLTKRVCSDRHSHVRLRAVSNPFCFTQWFMPMCLGLHENSWPWTCAVESCSAAHCRPSHHPTPASPGHAAILAALGYQAHSPLLLPPHKSVASGCRRRCAQSCRNTIGSASLRLMHLRILLLLGILRRTRGTDDGCIRDSPSAYFESLRLQILWKFCKELCDQLMGFPWMPKLTDRCLIRDRLAPQIDYHKLSNGERVVQCFLHSQDLIG